MLGRTSPQVFVALTLTGHSRRVAKLTAKELPKNFKNFGSEIGRALC